MYLITLAIITNALEEALHITHAAAKAYAMQLMDLFGYEDRIIDNVLDQADRQFFYILEKKGVLHTQREETTIYTGRKWRIRYWCLKKQQIEELHKLYHLKKSRKGRLHSTSDCGYIYSKLSKEMWNSRKTLR